MSQITVTGNLLDATGAAVVGAPVWFELVNTAGNTPYVTGTNIVVTTKVSVTTTSGGAFTAQIQGNDTITPAGTIYKVTFNSNEVSYYVFNGAGPFNLNSTAPLSVIPLPTGPVPTNILLSNNVYSGANAFPTVQLIDQSSTPAAAFGGNIALFSKTDKSLYMIDDTGKVTGPIGNFPWFDVKSYGAKGDTKQVVDAVINGTTTVVSATAGFTVADVGKQIWGVKNGGVELPHGTITAFVSSTTVTVSVAATQSDTGVTLTYGTDDTAAVQAAVTAAKASITSTVGYPVGVIFAVLRLPPGGFIVKSAPPVIDGGNKIWIEGAGKYSSVLFVPPDFAYSNTGTGNLITNVGDCHDFGVDGSNASLTLGNIVLIGSVSHARRLNIQNWKVNSGGNNVALQCLSDDAILEDIDANVGGTPVEIASLFAHAARLNLIGTDFGIQVADTSNVRFVDCQITGSASGKGVQEGPNSFLNEITFINCKIAGGTSAVNSVKSGSVWRFSQCWIEGTPAITTVSGASIYLSSCLVVGDGATCINNAGTIFDLGGCTYTGTMSGAGTYSGVNYTSAITGFGNGSAGTAVTTTTKNTGSGPATPQTIVKYQKVQIDGTVYWIPLVQ